MNYRSPIKGGETILPRSKRNYILEDLKLVGKIVKQFYHELKGITTQATYDY